MAWLMASSSSIIGRSGEITVRVEKLRNQRLQKSKRRKIFMDEVYTYSQEILQPIYAIYSDCDFVFYRTIRGNHYRLSVNGVNTLLYISNFSCPLKSLS